MFRSVCNQITRKPFNHRTRIEAFTTLPDAIQSNFRWATIAISTIGMRVLTFPLVRLQILESRKISQAMPAIQNLNTLFKGKVSTLKKETPSVRSKEIIRLTGVYLKGVNAALRSNGFSTFTFVTYPLISISVFVTFVYSIRSMLEYPQFLELFENGGPDWYWPASDLASRDSMYILPLSALGISYSGIEYSFKTQSKAAGLTANELDKLKEKIENRTGELDTPFTQSTVSSSSSSSSSSIPSTTTPPMIDPSAPLSSSLSSLSQKTSTYFSRFNIPLLFQDGIQCAMILSIPFVLHLPCAIFAYWIPSSLCGISQSYLLRQPSFQRLVGIPPMGPNIVQTAQSNTSTPSTPSSSTTTTTTTPPSTTSSSTIPIITPTTTTTTTTH